MFGVPQLLSKLGRTMYRAKIEYDDYGVDVGDWLPQTFEHYMAVGPFLKDGKELSWEEYWADPDNHVENWISLVMVVEKQCPHCNSWTVADAMGGLDYLESAQYPLPGVYTRDELLQYDDGQGLVQMFDELAHD
jgi:hypothetical protein